MILGPGDLAAGGDVHQLFRVGRLLHAEDDGLETAAIEGNVTE
ncbi:MAG: hypothetical protein R3F07_06715 [Opitutaceae bacterium]